MIAPAVLREPLHIAVGCIHGLASLATFAYITAQDAPLFNAWNWIVIIPVNMFLSAIWPVYWLILAPIFG